MSDSHQSTQNSPRTMSALPLSNDHALVWRQRKLLVKRVTHQPMIPLRALFHEDWLVDCLSRSPITMVLLDPALGEAQLQAWAYACDRAQKPAYLRLRSTPHTPHKQRPLYWQTKRLLDWIAAALLCLVLSPLMLFLAGLITVFSPGPIFFRQWRVGERGKLFRIIKFRTMVTGAERLHQQLMEHQPGLHKLQYDPRVTVLGAWMRKYSLDELPQLWNVLRGEMSLVGPRPWALYDAVRISPELQPRLNALPGMTGAWQVTARSHMTDLNTVNHFDLKYLKTWSLGTDFKCLILTIPKVLSGFGAF